MIRIDRNLVSSPLSAELVARVDDMLRSWFATPSDVRHRQTMPIGSLRQQINRQARAALFDVFCGKCAYCESFVDVSSPGEVDRFRPFTDATDLSGSGSPDHYVWLVAEWENLYLSCSVCSRAKRSLFPVEGPRAEPLTPFHFVRHHERPLLVDPCFDDPADHLQFSDTGHVQPRSHIGDVTIKVLNLNRRGLVSQRADTWVRIEAALTRDPNQTFEALHGPDQAYAAVARTAYQAFQAQDHAELRPRPFPPSYLRQTPIETRSADEILAADEEAFRLTARPLRSVEIRNFRALRDLRLEFGEPGSEAAPWLMLLGENATGKSTALQAIALALAGALEARRHTKPVKVLSDGAYKGFVRVWFWDQDTPAELTFVRDDERFGGTMRPSAIVLAYGAMRYAERRARIDSSLRPTPRFTLISPILQPIAKIRYPMAWLLDLDEKPFETAARALHAILPEAAGAVMRRTRSRVFFENDLPPRKWTGLSRSAFHLGGTDIAQSRMQAT